MYELCDLLDRSNVDVKISTRARIDNLDEKLLKRMVEVGFYKLIVGIESGDDETLKLMGRRYSQKDIRKSMEILERVKFPMFHFNDLIGFPWETHRHFKNTWQMNLEIPKSITYFVNVVTPIPLPATPLYEKYYREYGFKDWWLDPKKNEINFVRDEDKPFYQLLCLA